MMRMVLSCLAGALALGAAELAVAISVPDTATQLCSDKLQSETLLYVNAVQKKIRFSIKQNVKGLDAKAAGGFVCSGGANHGDGCNPTCAAPGVCSSGVCSGGAEDGDACGNAACLTGECAVKTTSGLVGAVRNAQARLRSKIAQFCTAGQLLSLFGVDGSTRCPDPDSPADGLDAVEVADCLLDGSIVGERSLIGDIMGRSAPSIVPGRSRSRQGGSPPPQVAVTTLGGLLQVGVHSPYIAFIPGGVTLLDISGSYPTVSTSSPGVIGNAIGPPIQYFVDPTTPVCLASVADDAGNGTPVDGSINFTTGEQSTFSPLRTSVHIGTICPRCVFGVCDGGPNATLGCSSPGTTDIACPPFPGAVELPIPHDLSTEHNALSVPANNPGGGATNPTASFCGACDVDERFGCQNDQDCIDSGVCSGVLGSGCCEFNADAGAFGVATPTSLSANGIRDVYLPVMASVFCFGKTGNPAVDAAWGLPGPARWLQVQWNSY